MAEALAFTQAANDLEAAAAEPLDRRRYEAALTRNQRLWSRLQAEVVLPDNPLPATIKTNLLNLSLFVDQQTIRALAKPSPGALRALVAINRDIAGGLMA